MYKIHSKLVFFKKINKKKLKTLKNKKNNKNNNNKKNPRSASEPCKKSALFTIFNMNSALFVHCL